MIQITNHTGKAAWVALLKKVRAAGARYFGDRGLPVQRLYLEASQSWDGSEIVNVWLRKADYNRGERPAVFFDYQILDPEKVKENRAAARRARRPQDSAAQTEAILHNWQEQMADRGD